MKKSNKVKSEDKQSIAVGVIVSTFQDLDTGTDLDLKFAFYAKFYPCCQFPRSKIAHLGQHNIRICQNLFDYSSDHGVKHTGGGKKIFPSRFLLTTRYHGIGEVPG